MLIRLVIHCAPSLRFSVANYLRQRSGSVAINVRQCGIMPGVSVVLGRTETEAKATIAQLANLADPQATLRVLSDRLGHDLSGLPLDGPVPELPPSGMMQGHAVALAAVARRHRMTLRELRDYTAAGSGHRVLHGTAEILADDLEAWFRSGAADRFIISCPFYPGPFDDFVEHVVPILVRRDLFRREYEGRTLREHLGLGRPPRTLRAPTPA